MKKCCTCKKLKSLQEYHKSKNQKDGHSARCKSCTSTAEKRLRKDRYKPSSSRVKFSVKYCKSCDTIKPKTKEFFWLTKRKELRANGEYAYYYVFKSQCKICHGAAGLKRIRKKRCKIYNCSLEDYEKHWRVAQVENKEDRLDKHYPYLFKLGLSKLQIIWIIKNIRAGYKWVSHEQWIIDSKKRMHKAHLKYKDLPEGYHLFKDVPNDEMNKIIMKREPIDAVLANRMCMKVAEVPKGVLEVKRIIHMINREIKKQKQ